jgi:hypothetical protein
MRALNVASSSSVRRETPSSAPRWIKVGAGGIGQQALQARSLNCWRISSSRGGDLEHFDGGIAFDRGVPRGQQRLGVRDQRARIVS